MHAAQQPLLMREPDDRMLEEELDLDNLDLDALDADDADDGGAAGADWLADRDLALEIAQRALH